MKYYGHQQTKTMDFGLMALIKLAGYFMIGAYKNKASLVQTDFVPSGI